ncbi:probable 35 kDa ribonuclease H [Rhynchosporium agropyri]|uniref:Ribonuclease n=2 Tax=Rhynchosporium TaxID=38037 RepID=A0A1E1LZC2_RHYSE|nr:probable 35 kDa ribonuclease H [Rhynchosporium agropyri]CZT42203.1 probable 35 kDa ribonuclease H [Rhynchosporium secalis]
MADSQIEDDITIEAPAAEVFIAPSINPSLLFAGASYTHFSPVPPSLLPTPSTPSPETTTKPKQEPGPPCALGVDEAGRGPVLGPMVYGLFYLPLPLSDPLLRTTHHFDDSKVLTPTVRSNLMEKLCTPSTDLHTQCGWAVEVMSARDIGANMMKPSATYNLNAQAMDATIALIKGVYERGVNVKEIFIDTIGHPATYQKRLERVFPTAKVVVAKKADSLYPCVSAASVCAKVTRDAALEVLYESYVNKPQEEEQDEEMSGTGSTKKAKVAEEASWGSGYPSDARCTSWLKRNMDPVFGWGAECRFSWGTAKDMLDIKGTAAKVEWPVEEDEETSRMTDYFNAEKEKEASDELGNWFGRPVGAEVF